MNKKTPKTDIYARLYKKPPKIPSEIYKALPSRTQFPLTLAVMMVIAAIYIFIFNEDKLLGIMLLLFAPSMALTSRAHGYETKRVYLTSNAISVDFIDENIKEDSLDKYEFLLTRQMLRNNYRYQVFIRKKDKNSRDILLIENITTPTNLRKWVEGLQNQLESPLPIKFSGEQIERDYKTGIYKQNPPDGKLISPNLLAKTFIVSLILASLFYIITHPKKVEHKQTQTDKPYNYNACTELNFNTTYCRTQREEAARFQRLTDQNLKED